MEPTGKLRWLKTIKGDTEQVVLQQEFVKLTLERAIKIWKDIPVYSEEQSSEEKFK